MEIPRFESINQWEFWDILEAMAPFSKWFNLLELESPEGHLLMESWTVAG